MENAQEIKAPTRKAFPPMMALVNPIAKNAFAMKFVREENLSNLGKNSGVQDRSPLDVMETLVDHDRELLFVVTYSQVCDAILVPRPYARIIDGDVEGILRFNIDGENVAERPVSRLLIKDMGDPLLDEPFKWQPTTCLFSAGHLTAKGALIADPPPIFVPTGSHMRISISGVPAGKQGHLEVGFLAASYTTRDLPSPNKPFDFL